VPVEGGTLYVGQWLPESAQTGGLLTAYRFSEYGSTAFPETIVTHASGPAEAVVLTDCGHLPHRERPDAVIAAIDRWVNRLGE
jgi:pimeloyl-ACP methyl ester carboxylesterase